MMNTSVKLTNQNIKDSIIGFIGTAIIKFIFLMIAVSFIVFFLLSVSPTDNTSTNIDQSSYTHLSAEKKAELNGYWNNNDPVIQRYCQWGYNALKGDLGYSTKYNKPVTTVIGERIGNTLLLLVSAWILSCLCGLILGTGAAMAKNNKTRKVIHGLMVGLSSLPLFWLGLLAIIVFSVTLGWFPTGLSIPIGMTADEISLGDRIYHMILPVCTLGTVGLATMALRTETKIKEIESSPYILFAVARGETKKQRFHLHILPHLLPLFLTISVTSVAEILGGTVLVEQVFSYPGLGQSAVAAGISGDAPLLAGIALICTAVVFIADFLGQFIRRLWKKGATL